MKVIIIGFNDNFVDKIQYHLELENHQILRINLHLEEEVLRMKNMDNNTFRTELKNFHDMTVEIMNFEPEVVFYFPLKIAISTDDFTEILNIIHVELVEHLIETLQVVNSKLCFMNLIFNKNSTKNLEGSNINDLDLKWIIEKRDKLIALNSKSHFLLSENKALPFEIILERISRYLKP